MANTETLVDEYTLNVRANQRHIDALDHESRAIRDDITKLGDSLRELEVRRLECQTLMAECRRELLEKLGQPATREAPEESALPAPAPTARSAAPAPAPTARSAAPAPAPTARSAAPAPARKSTQTWLQWCNSVLKLKAPNPNGMHPAERAPWYAWWESGLRPGEAVKQWRKGQEVAHAAEKPLSRDEAAQVVAAADVEAVKRDKAAGGVMRAVIEAGEATKKPEGIDDWAKTPAGHAGKGAPS